MDIDSKTKERASVTTERELANHRNAVGVVELLIQNHELIGVVPEDIGAAAAALEAKKSKVRYQKAVAKRGFCGCLGGSTDEEPPPSEESRRKISHLTSKATLDLLHGNTPARAASALE